MKTTSGVHSNETYTIFTEKNCCTTFKHFNLHSNLYVACVCLWLLLHLLSTHT